MNANQLWPGNDYAYAEYRPRGVSYVRNAKRVKVMRVRQVEPGSYEDRVNKRTVVDVVFPDDPYSPELLREVNPRNIFARWDDYTTEDEQRMAEEREQSEQRRREAERRAAERAEIMRKSEEKKQVVLDRLLALGIPKESITSISDSSIYINRYSLEREWGLNR